MSQCNVILGFFQNLSTAKIAMEDLKKHGFCRIASIHYTKNNHIEVNRPLIIPWYWLCLIALFFISTLIFYVFHDPFFVASSLLFVGTFLFCFFKYRVGRSVINRFKKCLFVDEVLVIAEVEAKHIETALRILRQVPAGHPFTFLLSPNEIKEHSLIETTEGSDPLSDQAIALANSQKDIVQTGHTSPKLLRELKKIESKLVELYGEISKAEHAEQASPSSTDWFLDNTAVLRESAEEIKRNLSKRFYRELPRVNKHPRIYTIACALVKGTNGKINKENIKQFIQSYQTVTPLTIGELWAFPLFLKFCLLEWVESLGVKIVERMRTVELANFWGNRLLVASQREKEKLPVFMKLLQKEVVQPTSQFAEELVDHLFDEEAALSLTKQWLETKFEVPLTDIFHNERIQQASEQLLLSSTIISLVALAQIAWQDIFEELSVVNEVLNQDPAGIYSKMDFSTRNMYRDRIERLSKRSGNSEVEVAQQCLKLAGEGNGVSKHVGYYLIDQGKSKLEYKVPLKEKIQNALKTHPASFYLGIIGVATASIVFYIEPSYLVLLALIPISEIVIQLFNFILSRTLPISMLPKMDYENGIPSTDKTLVVVPVILSDEASIKAEVNRLEIRCLANLDPNLYFSLFSDFKDAPHQHMDHDLSLVDLVIKEIQRLDLKYGPGKFFLFHRQRVWSPSENKWIGWERKRGKLEQLNRYLSGEPLDENILYYGLADALKDISYVITLDSDTQLAKNQGRELVEILSHPLNKPILKPDGKSLERGYTIIQPMVCTHFPYTRNSLFLEIFSDPSIVDPYTHAVSNVYQDLTDEASYHGKGIYDLKAFHSILDQRFPSEHILSHDLLEGSYVRVGATAAVCLFDSFPPTYYDYVRRQQRWIRGDWQIIDWLWPSTPTEKNPLSILNRWKIFDNLRRSLLPVSIVTLFLLAWFTTENAAIWTSIGLTAIVLPPFLQFIDNLFKRTSYESILPWHEVKLGFQRALINIALLPQEAYYTIDAIVKVFYRRWISHRHLLEWSASQKQSSTENHRNFLIKVSGGSLLALLLLLFVPHKDSEMVMICLLWMAGPFIIHYLNESKSSEESRQFTKEDRKFLRRVARSTWRYFDDFVNDSTNWLPPDNYQSLLNVGIAPRTSPTNIGLWLIGVLNAYDLKYITLDKVIEKVSATIHTLTKLEKYEGHLLNWYDIQTIKPLYPRYISTVDSGNLLASFWTLQQGLYEICNAPLIHFPALNGIQDTLCHLKVERELESLLSDSPTDLPNFIDIIKNSSELINRTGPSTDYWMKALQKQLFEWEDLISRYFKWVPLLKALSVEELHTIHIHAASWIDQVLNTQFSLRSLADGALNTALKELIEASQREDLSPQIRAWNADLREAVASAQWLAGEKLSQFNTTIETIESLSENMNLNYLYNEQRKLFTIGYNIDEMRLDQSFYDLLASEARLSSLVAIAKNDVPVEHWWSLGRPYGIVEGKKVLLSWGGTMFEYLMPVIFNKYYPDSLLGNGCKSAVDCQIRYGINRGIPWGISESAYSAIDSHKTYQYRSFGVVGLGLKRGLENDLVVSPYSSALALLINPRAAIDNLQRMTNDKNSMWGQYGFYESIDFTRQVDQEGVRGVVIHAFMAHHQGMSFAAINNLLNDDIVSKRFHRDPRISGVEFLLYEHIPLSPTIASKKYRKEIGVSKLQPFTKSPIMGVTETPHSPIPKINILSNQKYSVMLTNSGGGYSRWGEIDITRWRSDTTCDDWGSFHYIKDLESQQKWSATYHPTLKEGTEYSSSFKANKVEFRRKDEGIETFSEIVVSPEDNVEIRSITLFNKSDRKRSLEITSYQELVLASQAADRAHPAFNKLFIETEFVPEFNALIAFRRLRSPHETEIWSAHLIALESSEEKKFQYETSRASFIGRGRTLQDPLALDGDLSGTVGTVLDPIFSLRHRFSIDSGKSVKVSFVTLAADSREQLFTLLEKYQHLEASLQTLELAWSYSQLELRHLNITLEDVQLFQKLASRILYPHKQLRASSDRLESNRLGQSNLWKYGISGDLPLVVVSVEDIYDVVLVKQLIIAHTFWRQRGLKVDLLILNEEGIGYENPLKDQIVRLIHAHATHTGPQVYLFNVNEIPNEDLTLFLAVARVFLIAARGSLRQQLVTPMPATHYPSKFTVRTKPDESPSAPLPFLELPYFNGLGGYTPDGKTYDIYLGPNTNTPAPWINVIANEQFGTLVTETGNGSTWFRNSQSNRLTPWSNDPILNPISDAIYIRDEESGTYWNPTPSPIREKDAYRIVHGQGYSIFEHNSHGIEQELLITVPVNDPIRIQRIRLRNSSSRTRTLTITSYQDLILGPNKEETQMHLITKWNDDVKALFANNYYNSTYGQYVTFASSIPPAASYTGDRTEFIGRNGTLAQPASLKRKNLSNHVGPGFDPCAALQVPIVLKPGATEEIVFILGYAKDTDIAKNLISKTNFTEAISSTQSWWDHFLESVQVEVPDLAIKFALNRWLPYQNLSCRFWGRSGFYQSSGAYGFRDQLQDVMALVYSRPDLARQHIIRTASRQFEEGDVQHWWDPNTGAGVRTRFSDDLLWLPYVTAQYVRTTGDRSILEEQIPFIKAPPLEPDQHEIFAIPEISTQTASLLEHCRRSIKKGLTKGAHGLPLMGGGDWNDGMNRVGIQGKGESVWLSWFLIHVLNDYVELLNGSNAEEIKEYQAEAKRLKKAIEESAWDGTWYRRAYYDNGAPLGSKESSEAIIDNLAQSWSVLSGAGDPQRSHTALQSAFDRLVKVQERLVLLLTPAFDKTKEDPGYIKGYPPGVRENGGQYTHGSLWLAMAYARKGDGNRAVELLKMMHPYSHTPTMTDVDKYKIEPYVLPGDVYNLEGQVGRGGWSWYTGSCAWMYRIWLEEILGFKLRGNFFKIDCCIPKEWDGFKLRYYYKTATYEISLENPNHLNKGVPQITLDSKLLDNPEVPLVDDGKIHKVQITLKSQ